MDDRIPIAETFTSIQGEGRWAGTPTHFIRLAGCCVGSPMGGEAPHELCTLWDHRKFLCDTDYRMARRMSIEEIAEEAPRSVRICITGGEPLLHGAHVLALAWAFQERAQACSIETSATRPVPRGLPGTTWITVSPKRGWRKDVIADAQELKFLVDAQFSEDSVLEFAPWWRPGVEIYLQPVNGVHVIDRDNLQRCTDILGRHPDWKLSTQMHKVWDVR